MSSPAGDDSVHFHFRIHFPCHFQTINANSFYPSIAQSRKSFDARHEYRTFYIRSMRSPPARLPVVELLPLLGKTPSERRS